MTSNSIYPCGRTSRRRLLHQAGGGFLGLAMGALWADAGLDHFDQFRRYSQRRIASLHGGIDRTGSQRELRDPRRHGCHSVRRCLYVGVSFALRAQSQPAGASAAIQNVGISVDQSGDLSRHGRFPRRIDHRRSEARALHSGSDRFYLSALPFCDEKETLSRGKRRGHPVGP